MTTSPPVARLALVGDRSPHVRSHTRIPLLLDALRQRDRVDLDPYWVSTVDAEEPGALAGFDGIWLLPGGPYASQAGGVAAARAARERRIPFLGTCAGFQHALLDVARNVCGLAGAQHAEYTPGAAEAVIVELACSLAGHEQAVRLAPGSLVATIMGSDRTVERYLCAYGLDQRYVDRLRAAGLEFTGTDGDGAVRVAELPGHPFFLATLFQPELAGETGRPHPIVVAFGAAVCAYAAESTLSNFAPLRA